MSAVSAAPCLNRKRTYRRGRSVGRHGATAWVVASGTICSPRRVSAGAVTAQMELETHEDVACVNLDMHHAVREIVRPRIVDARLLIVRVRAILPEEGARPHESAFVAPREPTQADKPGNRLD